MLTKIDAAMLYGKQHDGFGTQTLYPGLACPSLNDSGFFTLGRIDRARIKPGTYIPMHAHRDDEILTYLRSGKAKHFDPEGLTGIISSQKVMMMNAGTNSYHEELVLEDGGVLEGLQIFIRPEAGGLRPQVQFHQLQDVYSANQWRKIAGEGKEYPLQIRSKTWVMDIRLEKGTQTLLPGMYNENAAFLFYVFDGKLQVSDDMILSAGESALMENENPLFNALETTDIVLCITKKDAAHFDGGMYSGNLVI